MERTSKHFRKRDAILRCVRSTQQHPSAEWVYENVRQEVQDISLATVYRNLSLFKEQGLIQSLGTVKGIERFDGNTAPHVHFVCNECSAVIDLPSIAVPQELTESVAMETGGQIQSCSLSFTGLCSQCKNKL